MPKPHKRVLLIDDDKKVLASLTKLLAELQLQLIGADDFASAQQQLKTPCALVLLNAELKAGNGYELFEKIRKIVGANTPIIITSHAADATTQFKQHQKKTPANGYLQKPYNLLDLLDLIVELVPLSDLLQVNDTTDDTAKWQATIESLKSEQLVINKQNEELQHQVEQLKTELAAVPPPAAQSNNDEQLAAIEAKHKKAQTALRDFYRDKIKKLESTAGSASDQSQQVAELTATIEKLRDEVKQALAEQQHASEELEKERKLRKKISEVLKG